MVYCFYCKKKSNFKKGLSVHAFPKNEIEKKQWIINMGFGSNWTPTKCSGICSDHFAKNCIDKRDKVFRLRKGSIPTIFDHNKQDKISDVLVTVKSEEMNEGDPLLPSLDNPISPPWTPSLSDQIRAMYRDHTYISTPEVLMRKAKNMKNKYTEVLTVNKNLLKKNKKTTSAIINLKKTARKLKKSNQSSDALVDTKKFGSTASELIQRISKNSDDIKSREKYSPELRSFASTLHSYSPKAYDFVRKSFSNALPHPSQLRNWNNSAAAEPGLSV